MDLSSDLEGAYAFRAVVTDVAGNTAYAGPDLTLVYDNSVEPVGLIAFSTTYTDSGSNSSDRISNDSAFVLTLLDLARRLKLKTVAERVQDEEAARILAENGCDYLQGKLIGLAALERQIVAPSDANGAVA